MNVMPAVALGALGMVGGAASLVIAEAARDVSKLRHAAAAPVAAASFGIALGLALSGLAHLELSGS